MLKKINKLYNKIELNLGIKTVFRKIEKRIQVKNNLINVRFFFENIVVYKIYDNLNKYIISRIIAYYGADYKWNDEKSQNLDKMNNNLGYGSFHYSLVRNMRPKRILCVGSMYGYIPYMLAKACQDNNYGHVDFVDAGFDINSDNDSEIHNFGQGFWKKINTRKYFNFFLNNSFITSHIMTTNEFKKKNSKQQYDYIYLDGDHTYKGAVNDLKLFWPLLKNEGFICFHDIHFVQEAEGIKFEYWKIWNKLKVMPFKFELSNHYSGLGFVQKMGDKKLPNNL